MCQLDNLQDPEGAYEKACDDRDHWCDMHTVAMKRNAELEDALRDALGSFQCTQRILDYPRPHWSRRACALLGESTAQPGLISFPRP